MVWWFTTEMALISWDCFQSNKQIYSLKICSLKVLFMIKVELFKKYRHKLAFILLRLLSLFPYTLEIKTSCFYSGL